MTQAMQLRSRLITLSASSGPTRRRRIHRSKPYQRANAKAQAHGRDFPDDTFAVVAGAFASGCFDCLACALRAIEKTKSTREGCALREDRIEGFDMLVAASFVCTCRDCRARAMHAIAEQVTAQCRPGCPPLRCTRLMPKAET